MTLPLTDNHLDAAITGWVTPAWAAELLKRPKRTIRNWAKAGDVASTRHPQLGLMVDMTDCARLAATRQRRKRDPKPVRR